MSESPSFWNILLDIISLRASVENATNSYVRNVFHTSLQHEPNVLVGPTDKNLNDRGRVNVQAMIAFYFIAYERRRPLMNLQK